MEIIINYQLSISKQFMATIQIQIGSKGSTTKKVKYHNPLKQAVITTVSFFDIFDRPLKLKEIEEYLFRTAASEIDVAIMLKRLRGAGIIQEQRGYFYLRSKSLANEIKRKTIKKKLISQAFKAKNILRHVPFIRSIMICNSLALGGVKKSSDIDFFIITKKNRIYLTRILAIFLLKLFRFYQNKTGEPKKTSLGFFVDEEGLNIKKIKLHHDPYLFFWIASLKPIFGFKYYYKFCWENNWVKKELPNFFPKKGHLSKRTLWQKMLEIFVPGVIIDGLENLSRRLQQKRISSLPENSWPTSTTIAKKHILKLHAEDKREYFREKLKERLKENLKTV